MSQKLEKAMQRFGSCMRAVGSPNDKGGLGVAFHDPGVAEEDEDGLVVDHGDVESSGRLRTIGDSEKSGRTHSARARSSRAGNAGAWKESINNTPVDGVQVPGIAHSSRCGGSNRESLEIGNGGCEIPTQERDSSASSVSSHGATCARASTMLSAGVHSVMVGDS
jgi:hypothetical protein